MRGDMNPLDGVELIYTIKAWYILSENGSIDDNELLFNTFYGRKIEVKKLISIFEKLGKQYKVFKLYQKQSNKMKSIDDARLIELLTFIKEVKELPRVNDAFYTTKNIIHDFSVSNQVAQFGIKLLNGNSESIYVPFTNGFVYAYYTNKKIYAENQIPLNELVAELINIIDKGNIEFYLTNTLEKPSFINPDAPHLLKQFESVLSFPSFGVKGKLDTSNDKFNRFKVHKGANLDVAYFEHILAQTKVKAVILMPVGFTYRSGTEEKFRKYLIENNYLEAIIQLPPNLYSATAIETTFFIIHKERSDHKIQFINLKHEKFFTKEGRQTVFKNIDELVDIYRSRSEREGISALVDHQVIEMFNYSLAIDRYIFSSEAKKIKEKLSSYEMVEIGMLAEVRRSQLFKDEEEGKEVYELSPSDFSSAGFTMECGKLKHLGDQSKKYETYKLRSYDILLSTKGTIGKVAIIGEINEPLIASQAIQVIRLQNVLDLKKDAIVLYMFLKSDIGQAMLKQLVVGVSMPQIATIEVKQLQVPQMPEVEKERIVDNFKKEIKMEKEIEMIKQKISEIHNNFLGEAS